MNSNQKFWPHVDRLRLVVIFTFLLIGTLLVILFRQISEQDPYCFQTGMEAEDMRWKKQHVGKYVAYVLDKRYKDQGFEIRLERVISDNVACVIESHPVNIPLYSQTPFYAYIENNCEFGIPYLPEDEASGNYLVPAAVEANCTD